MNKNVIATPQQLLLYVCIWTGIGTLFTFLTLFIFLKKNIIDKKDLKGAGFLGLIFCIAPQVMIPLFFYGLFEKDEK